MTLCADFHVHPDYSIDAKGTIRQYCDRALEIGLRHICFTTHYDTNPKRVEQDGYWKQNGVRVRMNNGLLQQYLDEIEKARGFFSGFGLRVYRGLEIDYFPGVEKEVEHLRANFPLDFVIGSVHCLDDIAISDKNEAPGYFLKKSLSQMADDYFAHLRQAAAFPGFDSLGHLDYYVRYGREYYGDDIDRIEFERFDEVFAILAGKEHGIEVNSSPFRYGIEGFHPTREIIKRAVGSGVKIGSVGSDSHKPEKLSLGLREAYEYLDTLNVKPKFPHCL